MASLPPERNDPEFESMDPNSPAAETVSPVFEHNLRLLLARSWRPVKPDEGFTRDLLSLCEEHAQGRYPLRAERSRFHPARRPWAWAAVAAAAALLFALVRPLWLTEGPVPTDRASILAAGDVALRPLPAGELALSEGSGRAAWRPWPSDAVLVVEDQSLQAHLPASAGLEVRWDQAASAWLDAGSVVRLHGTPGLLLEQGSARLESPAGKLALATPRVAFELQHGRLRLERSQDRDREVLDLWLSEGELLRSGTAPLGPRPEAYRFLDGVLSVDPASGDGSASAPDAAGAGKTRVADRAQPGVHDPSQGPEDGDAGTEDAAFTGLDWRVRTADGEPVPRFRLWSRREVELPNVSEPEASEHEVSDGLLRHELLPGTYTLGLEAPGLAPFLLQNQVIEPGGVHSQELQLSPGRRIQGYVVDSDSGAPLAGALVVVESSLPHQVLHAQGLDLDPLPWTSARSDAAGRWVLEHAPPGAITLRTSSLGFAPARREVQARSAGEAQEEASPLELAPITLGQGGRLVGDVRSSDGSPTPLVPVIASRIQMDGGSEPMTYGSAETDPSGRFSMEGLPEGNYVVLLPLEAGSGGTPRIRHVRIREGQLTTILFPGSGSAGAGVELEGLVRLGDGTPAAQAKLTLEPVVGGGWQSTAADDAGRVVFSGVPPGSYEVSLALGAGYDSVVYQERLEVGTDARQSFEVRAGIGRIGGQLPRATGGFLYLQQLRAGEWRSVASARIDHGGRWSLIGLPPGRLRGAVFGRNAAEGYAAIEEQDFLGTESELSHAALAPCGSLIVRVRDAQGRPLRGALVRLTGEDRRPLFFSPNARTNGAGELPVPIVPEGPWLVTVFTPGAEPLQRRQVFSAGDTFELDFTAP